MSTMRVSRRNAPPAEPGADEQEKLRTVLQRVVVVSEAWALANPEPKSLEVRYYPRPDVEVPDSMPDASEVESRRAWLRAMAQRLHDTVDVEPPAAPQPVNCHSGRARSPAVVLAWLRLHHGLRAEHLQWALGELERRNTEAGHTQKLDGALERFGYVLRNL